MRITTFEKAKKQAQANANWTGVPWVIFTDTSGNQNVERYDESLTCHKNGKVFHPKKIKENKK